MWGCDLGRAMACAGLSSTGHLKSSCSTVSKLGKHSNTKLEGSNITTLQPVALPILFTN